MSLPLTICALTYGSHTPLCRRFLESLYGKTQAGQFHLRLGLNAACEETRALAADYAARHGNLTVVDAETNLFKSPMMRRLMHDPPIATEWTAWFDDDSHILRADWLLRLSVKMQAEPHIDAWGVRYLLFPNADALRFVTTAPWYRGKRWNLHRDENGSVSPCFIFPTGGFWVVRTRVLMALDWPDRRLQQAGDDFFFGEALHQNGFEVGSFERCIAISDAPRRNAAASEVAMVPVV
jgi:hypothetical protein